MAELGHRRYVVSGGDIGRGVAMALAANHADRVAALHVTDVPAAAAADDARPLTAEERDHRDRVEHWRATEGGYLREQATKPHTLAVALGGSPPDWPPGSSRSSGRRATAVATSSRSFPARTCSPGSPPTG